MFHIYKGSISWVLKPENLDNLITTCLDPKFEIDYMSTATKLVNTLHMTHNKKYLKNNKSPKNVNPTLN